MVYRGGSLTAAVTRMHQDIHSRSVQLYGILILTAATLVVGCNRSSSRSSELTVPESATNVQSAFLGASEDIRQAAGEVVSAAQAANPMAAYVHLENLSSKPALTAEQKQAVFEMQMALVHQLQAESAKGNAAAEELLNRYRSSK